MVLPTLRARAKMKIFSPSFAARKKEQSSWRVCEERECTSTTSRANDVVTSTRVPTAPPWIVLI